MVSQRNTCICSNIPYIISKYFSITDNKKTMSFVTTLNFYHYYFICSNMTTYAYQKLIDVVMFGNPNAK